MQERFHNKVQVFWVLLSVGKRSSYLEQRHLSGLLDEEMHFVDLLADQWWDWIAASNDALGFSKDITNETQFVIFSDDKSNIHMQRTLNQRPSLC